jgi:spore germination cell wall hydrolase CwlJ-like protein
MGGNHGFCRRPGVWRRWALAALGAICLAAWSPAQAAKGLSEADREIRCLALTLYFEARGEPEPGRRAVGHVVMNRVADSGFPDKVCKVVRQGGARPLNRCQFSWWCDGQSDRPEEAAAWARSNELARAIYWGFTEDPTQGALWFHAEHVRPSWRNALLQGPRIGRHVFYGRARLDS